jgi:hypothetical protein
MKTHDFAALAFAASVGLAAQSPRPDRDARIVTAARQSYNFRFYLKADDIQVRFANRMTIAHQGH